MLTPVDPRVGPLSSAIGKSPSSCSGYYVRKTVILLVKRDDAFVPLSEASLDGQRRPIRDISNFPKSDELDHAQIRP